MVGEKAMNIYSELNEAEIERLVMLAEECSEVIQIVSKILRHGYHSKWPENTGPTTRQRLEQEIGDVVFCVSFMAHRGDVDANAMEIRTVEKSKTVNQYMHHNIITDEELNNAI
jgi:NTP pyrophosphatase (non-canonical NTP hydrolase)